MHAGMGTDRGSADFRWKKNVRPPKIKRSAQIRMKMFYTKLKTGKTGRCKAVLCSFLKSIFLLKSFRGLRVAPWTPTGDLLRPQAPAFQLTFSILNSHAWHVCMHVCEQVRFHSRDTSKLWIKQTQTQTSKQQILYAERFYSFISRISNEQISTHEKSVHRRDVWCDLAKPFQLPPDAGSC